ncbi:MAG: cysteine hydrolase family protein [Planctomycetota bacterium]
MPEIVPSDATGGPPAALLLVDVINDFDFPEGPELLAQAQEMMEPLMELKRRCRERGLPVIYANDNFGAWRSDMDQILGHCLHHSASSSQLIGALAPEPEDYVVIKPKHSAFYCTALDLLLRHLAVDRLILAGLAGNICVFFSAYDAHMREIEVVVASDCTASNTRRENDFALEQIERVLGGLVLPGASIDLERLISGAPRLRAAD